MIKYLYPFLTTTLCLLPAIAHAQIYQPSNRTPVADSTQIGTQVSGSGNNFNITGGLNKGQTLFHSFTDFSVPTDGQASFSNPVGNRDIITRVTGNIFSDINGTVNTNGANFFLINPNGIVFGTKARLNVGKAFVGSTANSIDLVDAGGRTITFGTNASGDALLSVAPNVLFDVSRLNIGGGNGQISNFGMLETNNPNQYIGLIGGNVSMNAGELNAPGANVELGGLSQSGNIEFSIDKGIKLPANVERGNVSLVTVGTSPSIIDVESGGGGSVGIFAKDITLQGTGTYIASGIATGLGSPAATAGDIKLDATGDVMLSEGDIFNQVASGGVGKGGNVEITTRNLFLTNVSRLTTSIFGEGEAGNVKITATGKISFDGAKGDFNLASGAFSTVEEGASGKGGNVEITTRNLDLTNGARLSASAFGKKGEAGSVKITAADKISFDGVKDRFISQEQ